MFIDKINLEISTPTEPIVTGRGFYQIEEGCLFVQIGQFHHKRRFFSYLENEAIRFDIDKAGKLIFIEISIPKNQWQIKPDLPIPKRIEAADIRWMDFRKDIIAPQFYSDPDNNNLKVEFIKSTPVLNYYLADRIIAQVSKDNRLCTIWILDIIDDIAGKEIRAFRRNSRLAKAYFA